MKKLIIPVLMLAALCSCKSDGKGNAKESEKTTSPPIPTFVITTTGPRITTEDIFARRSATTATTTTTAAEDTSDATAEAAAPEGE